jgi:polysaccharide export outer membrane protein
MQVDPQVLPAPMQIPTPVASQAEPQARVASPTLHISAGDLLQIRVFDTPELSGALRVSQTGTVRLPVGGEVAVAGLTPDAAANAIEDRLKSAHIMLYPHVQVTIGEFASNGVTVLGEVKTPGNYPLLGSHTLPDVIAAAGGLGTLSGDTIVVVHANDLGHPITVNGIHSADFASNNMLLDPGDRVTVTKAGVVYVLGAVGRAGGFVIDPNGGLSILQALTLAQGFTQIARQKNAVIIRKDTGQVQRIGANLSKVLAGTMPDSELRNGDVLYVPTSLSKTMAYRGIEAAIEVGTGFVIYRQ